MSYKYKVVSLFSGIGGFEAGLEKSNLNYEVVFSSEIDKYAQVSYKANYASHNLNGDITAINEEMVPDHDILLAGFPCQAFSIAGKRKGFEDTRGTLFFDVLRILNKKKPRIIILENVKNLISHDSSNTINTILNSLNELGYVVDFSIINSFEAGVPQNRERTYFVGVLNGDTEKFTGDLRNKKINDLKMQLNNDEYKGFNFFNNLTYDVDSKSIADILFSNVDIKYFFSKKIMEEYLETLEVNDIEIKASKIVKLFDLPKYVHNDNERQRRVYSTKGISPTILARSDTTKIYLQDGEKQFVRKLTPFENFRVQGFDDEFINNIVKSGMSETQMYKQSGNAVSPPVITGIVNLIVSTFETEIDDKGFKFIDLFCGLGGFRIALQHIGGECVFSSDIDKYVRQTYCDNYGHYPEGDITKIKSEEIPEHDILCAGFPCQPFSLAGKRLGFEDTRGTLFFDVARIIKDKKPKGFILENVAGLVNHDNGNTIKVIEDTLVELGYDFKWQVMNTLDYGVPQNRNRWYCVGVRKDLNTKFIDSYVFPKKKELDFTLENVICNNVGNEYDITSTAKINIEKYLDDFKKSSKYDNSKVLIAYDIRASRCRFRCDNVLPCLTAKMGTGGNNVPVIVSQNRKLTEKECLLLMGYPDWYKIKKNNMQSYKQIGNSVVVPIVEMLAKELLKCI